MRFFTLAIFGLEKVFSLENVQGWFQAGGYFMLFGLLFACGLGLPLPEDIPLMLGGYFASLGKMDLVVVCIVGWLGIMGGDSALYWMSRRYGMSITKVRMIGTHVTKERILWAEKKFESHGVWVVGFCRMIAGIRGAMVIAAGVLRFNFVKFIIADGIAAIVSGGLFIYLGWLGGKWFGSVSEMRERMRHYEHYVILGFVILVLLFILYVRWRRRRHTTLSEVAVDKVAKVAVKVAQATHITPKPPGDASLGEAPQPMPGQSNDAPLPPLTNGPPGPNVAD